jgi:hypothetical protein
LKPYGDTTTFQRPNFDCKMMKFSLSDQLSPSLPVPPDTVRVTKPHSVVKRLAQ